MNGVNSVDHLKKRIINDEFIEYDYLEGVCPIMNEEAKIYREMKVDIPKNLKTYSNGMIM